MPQQHNYAPTNLFTEEQSLIDSHNNKVLE